MYYFFASNIKISNVYLVRNDKTLCYLIKRWDDKGKRLMAFSITLLSRVRLSLAKLMRKGNPPLEQWWHCRTVTLGREYTLRTRASNYCVVESFAFSGIIATARWPFSLILCCYDCINFFKGSTSIYHNPPFLLLYFNSNTFNFLCYAVTTALRNKHPFTNAVKFQINTFLLQIVINFAFSSFLL